jgi:EmrB/QacA subfamily drug resistance transporter
MSIATDGGLDGGTTRPKLSLATLSLVLFLTFLDNTVISVVLGDVQSTLHAGVSDLQWVVGAYALVFASLMLPAGSLSDRLGRKKVMLAGVAIFCVGSVIGAVAQNVDVLWAGRAIMGLGAAASEPGTLSMIRHLFPDRRDRAQALGVWAAISGLALAAGPVIGGLLIGLWSWRAVFWFNLVFGLLALAGAIAVLPENSDPTPRGRDAGGYMLGIAGIACATFATIAGETSGYQTSWVDLLFVIAGVLLVAFVVVERRAENPMLNVRFFRVGAFAGSTFVAFATYFGVFSIFFFVALYLEEVGSQSGYHIALDFLPMAAVMVVASALTGRWVAAAGSRIPMALGCAAGCGGIVWTALVISPTSGLGALGLPLALAGVGFGVTVVPVTSVALNVIPPEHSGMAASATNTSRELGALAGVAVLGSIVNGQLTVDLTRRLAAIGIPQAFRHLVINAVITGTITSQASSAEKNKAISAIVTKVTGAAYAAFAHGLHLALGVSGALMFLAVLAAAGLVRRLTPERAAGLGLSRGPVSGEG